MMINPAKMAYEIIDTFQTKELVNYTLQFKLPLHYKVGESFKTSFGNSTINVVANLIQARSSSSLRSKLQLGDKPEIIVFLQGGPGFPCPKASYSGYTKELLKRGYQILYLDQRGTGLSTPIEAETIKEYGGSSVEKQLEFVLNFRADSIVLDCEKIRLALLEGYADQRWSLLGQSYGGFCSVSYLSMFPSSLKKVLLTGGIPPIGFTPDDVYHATYKRTAERNLYYYKKYPADVKRVRDILKYLYSNKTILPNGGSLTVERFQQLGLGFGSTGGTDFIHNIVFKFHYDLTHTGKPSYQILSTIQQEQSFDTNIIYALFQEAIYCEGKMSSNWSADRLRYKCGDERFDFDACTLSNSTGPIFFTGEMVYKSMFDDYSELTKIKDLAYALHDYSNWSILYDTKTLAKITDNEEGHDEEKHIVLVAAATYYHDQYVDFDLSMIAKSYIGGIKQYITSEYFHNGLRADPEKVLSCLFDLTVQEVD